ncbi:hypothetical protein JOH50_006251 [Rhizobium leguminosarum]|nr:hypothetical protein [Rhizobium leguminosarum]
MPTSAPTTAMATTRSWVVAQTSDTTGPFALDRRAAFGAELAQEVRRQPNVFDDDPDVGLSW